MDNTKRSKLDANKRFSDVNKEHQAILDGIPDYGVLRKAHDATIGEIVTAGDEQEKRQTAEKAEVIRVKTVMVEAVHAITSRASVKAGLTGQPALEKQLDVSVTYFLAANKNPAVSRCTVMLQLVRDNLPTLTTVTEAEIVAAAETVTAYSLIMNKPVEDIQHKKSRGTDPLPGLLKIADKQMTDMLKLATSALRKTNPEIITELTLAKQIINTGIRYNSISLTVVDAATGAPLEAATVLSVKQQKTYTSNYEGIASIGSHPNGHHNFTIAAEGYLPQTMGLDITKGRLSEFVVKLVGE